MLQMKVAYATTFHIWGTEKTKTSEGKISSLHISHDAGQWKAKFDNSAVI